MKRVNDATLLEIIELSKLLGEYGNIKRATLMPNGESESDSHHAFSLALMAYELASHYASELDTHKILLYALVHDLPELVTGDMSTLLASENDLLDKAKRDAQAMHAVRKRLHVAPNILLAIENYEAKVDEESKFVYWLDKMVTIPTHFYDNGANLHKLGIETRSHISNWYQTTLAKLERHASNPHESASKILHLAYQKMYDELFDT